MKKLMSSILLALFFLTAVEVMPAAAGQYGAVSVEDKKKDGKKKDPPGPVVVREKDTPKGRDSERPPKKDKKPGN